MVCNMMKVTGNLDVRVEYKMERRSFGCRVDEKYSSQEEYKVVFLPFK